MGVIYVVPVDSESLGERIEDRGTFTDAIHRDWGIARLDVCLLSSDNGETLTHASLIARGDMFVTYQRRVRFTDFVEFGEPLPFRVLLQEIPHNLQQHALARQHGGALPPATWNAVIAAVKALRPAAAAEIERIEQLARNPSPSFSGRAVEIVELERDALGLALMIAEIDRTEILGWREPESPQAFIRGLPFQGAIEDRLVDYDATVFGNWRLVNRSAAGAAVFSEGRNRLTVINVNRMSVEHALGVDLVYFNHRFRAYVLVQYKRMRKESTRSIYRPDSSLESELARMRRLPISRESSSDIEDYRLHPGSCYLKLCPESAFRTRDANLIRGMYIPLDFWDELIRLGTIVGPRGGVGATFENVGRHVNSSLFAALVREGWIGSRVSTTDFLERVVDELLESGHSVTLAEHERMP